MSDWSEHLHGWYDRGAILPPAVTTAYNGGKAEPVTTAEQIKRGLDYIREHYADDEEDCD